MSLLQLGDSCQGTSLEPDKGMLHFNARRVAQD
jgi:hypothetical protein